MKWSILGLVVIGVLAAFCASILAGALRFGAHPAASPARALSEEFEILVAKAELPAMSIVDARGIETRMVRREAAGGEYLTDPIQVMGKVLTVPMVKGEVFTKAVFAKEGSGLHLASALPEGKRAIGVSLTDHAGLAGLLYPGCVVDVLTSTKTFAGKTTATQTLLECIQVLSIEDRTIVTEENAEHERLKPSGQRKRHVVTLLVDSHQAEQLHSAMEHATISLALRNPMDQARSKAAFAPAPPKVDATSPKVIVVSPKPASLVSLPPAPAPAPEEKVWEVTVIRGCESEMVTFPYPSTTHGVVEGTRR